ncbi:MAG: Ycf66 family protein [Cyanobacteria bacterium P01_A01_bin.123]
MLANLLALAVGFGSFGLYMAAFFFPEVHRRQDFAWSGVGMFYALVLWFCAGRMTGAVLLGQTASVALLLSLEWQMLSLRRSRTPENLRTPIADDDILPAMGELASSTVDAVTDLPGLAQVKALGNRSRKLATEVTKPVSMTPKVAPTVKIDRHKPRPTTAKLRFRYQYEYLEDLPGEAVLPAETIEIAIEVPIPQPELSPSNADMPPGNGQEKAIQAAANTVDIASVIKTADGEPVEIAEQPKNEPTPATIAVPAPENLTELGHNGTPTHDQDDTSSTANLSDEPNLEQAAITAKEEVRPQPSPLEPEESNWPEDDLDTASKNAIAPNAAVQTTDNLSEITLESEPPQSPPHSQAVPPKSETAQRLSRRTYQNPPSPASGSDQPDKPTRPKPSLWQSAVILKDWVQEWATSTRKPKPSKPVIKIPPRSPSIPRPEAVAQSSENQAGKKDAIATAELIEDDFDDIFGDDEEFN